MKGWLYRLFFPLPEGVSKGIVRPVTQTAPKYPPPKTPQPGSGVSIDGLTTAYDKSFKVSLQEIEDAIRQIRDFGR